MGNGEEKKFLTDADYMLEYDRRKIQDCADVFRNLASAISQQDEKEAPFWPQEESAEEQEEILDRESCMQEENARQSRKSLAAQMKQLAGLLQDVAGAVTLTPTSLSQSSKTGLTRRLWSAVRTFPQGKDSLFPLPAR